MSRHYSPYPEETYHKKEKLRGVFAETPQQASLVVLLKFGSEATSKTSPLRGQVKATAGVAGTG